MFNVIIHTHHSYFPIEIRGNEYFHLNMKALLKNFENNSTRWVQDIKTRALQHLFYLFARNCKRFLDPNHEFTITSLDYHFWALDLRS